MGVELRVKARRCKEFLLESPACRTLFAALGTVIASVLSSAFIVEITTAQGRLDWRLFHSAVSFYFLLALVVLLGLYNRKVYLKEKELLKFLDRDYCIAYMRSKLLPEAADRYREIIRTGQVGELTRATSELRRILDESSRQS